MPKIQQQKPATTNHRRRIQTTRSNNLSILDQIRDVSEIGDSGIKMNIYGRNGTGKTTFACTFPKPLLLIGFEDGTKSVRRVQGVKFVRVTDTTDLFVLAKHLRSNDNPFATVVLDTATSLQDLVLKEVLGLEEIPVQLAWGMVSQNQYRQRSEKTKELLRLFVDLSLNVIILAQEKNHTNQADEPGLLDSELLAPFIASSLGSSTCSWLQDSCDYICQTYTREQVIQKTIEKEGKKPTTISKKTGQIEFCLRTQRAHPVFAAKIRADREVVFPEVMVDPSYEKIAQLLNGEPQTRSKKR